MSQTAPEKPRTYRLQSSAFLNAPGLLAWARNGFKFGRDREKMIAVINTTWPGVTHEAAEALLSGAITETLDGDTVVFNEPEPAKETEMKEYMIRIVATARVFNEDTIEATSLEDAIEKASKIDLEDYLWGFRYSHDVGVEGDEIAYIVEDEDHGGDETAVDLREDGEPFSWDACDIVKDLAKISIGEISDDQMDQFIGRARAACSKSRSDMET